MDIISKQKCFGGHQLRIKHQSTSLNCSMHFSLYLPPQEQTQKVPLLTWLSGLTCTDENFVIKAGAQQYAAKEGVALLVPDTSPRGENVPDCTDDSGLGKGAGFYLNAIQSPWDKHYQMEQYITQELQMLMRSSSFNLDLNAQGIFGHSMGGHGALILGLKYPAIYACISALAPVCAPSTTPWGQAAFKLYLGEDTSTWQAHDACEILLSKGYNKSLLIDIGSADPYLADKLCPEKLKSVCHAKNVDLNLRLQDGYDHSYFFVASFIADHIDFHKRQMST